MSSESHQNASPISKKRSVTLMEPCKDPFTNESDETPPATHPLDMIRRRSSSVMTSSLELKHKASPSQIRGTQSSPTLPKTSRHQETNPEIERRTSLSRNPTPAQAPESEVFIKTKTAAKILTPREIDNELLSVIRDPTDKTKKTKKVDLPKESHRNDQDKQKAEPIGYVYVLKNPDWPKHVKIGITRQSVQQRKKQIRKACDFQQLERVVDGEQMKFPNYRLVEKLCHVELRNFQKTFLCNCRKPHTGGQLEHHEWFEVSEDTAVETVQRWRTWLRLSPYDENGNLMSWWRERAGSGLFSKEPFGQAEEETIDHKSRHQRWSLWLRDPTMRDLIGFEFWKFFFEARSGQKSRWKLARENPERLGCFLCAVCFFLGPKESTIILLILLFVV